MRRRLPLLGWLLAAGCSVGQPDVPLESFVAGDLDAVHAFAAREAAEGAEENRALLLNVEAQCDLLGGRIEEARKNFEAAGRIMGSWATSGSEDTGESATRPSVRRAVFRWTPRRTAVPDA